MNRVSFDLFGIEPTYYIDAVIEFDIVAGKRVTAFNEERKAVDGPSCFGGLDEYGDFIDTVTSVIADAGFTITDSKQSRKGYTYYVDFIPVDEKGNMIREKVQVRFGISDHIPIGGGDSTGGKRVFKSFSYSSAQKYRDPFSLVLGVDESCKAIKQGDFSGLMRI